MNILVKNYAMIIFRNVKETESAGVQRKESGEIERGSTERRRRREISEGSGEGAASNLNVTRVVQVDDGARKNE